jgi:hypothetical protein
VDFRIDKLLIPESDPRFDEMRAYLQAARRRGRYSPIHRMVLEWALLGFRLWSGKIPIGGRSEAPLVNLPADLAGGLPDPQALDELNRRVDAVFDDLFA